MQLFFSFVAWVRRIEAALAALLLGVIVSVVFVASVLRYFDVPIIWSEELAQGLFVWLAMLASDLTLQRAGHFRIDMFVNFLPHALQTALDIVIKVMIAALLIGLLLYSAELLRVSHPRPLPMLDIPSSYVALALPTAFALMLLTTIEQIVHRLRGDVEEQSATREVM